MVDDASGNPSGVFGIDGGGDRVASDDGFFAGAATDHTQLAVADGRSGTWPDIERFQTGAASQGQAQRQTEPKLQTHQWNHP